MHLDPAHLLSAADLERIYPAPSEVVRLKTSDRISAAFARLIAHSPLVMLATGSAAGLDCSPRGDPGQVAYVEDERTLLLPDRPGNNRIDSLRNILANPQVALTFILPGMSEVARVNGSAQLSTDPALLTRFTYKTQLPRCVLVVTVHEAYLHCGRALLRSGIWTPEGRVAPGALPNLVQMLRDQTKLALSDDALVIEDR